MKITVTYSRVILAFLDWEQQNLDPDSHLCRLKRDRVERWDQWSFLSPVKLMLEADPWADLKKTQHKFLKMKLWAAKAAAHIKCYTFHDLFSKISSSLFLKKGAGARSHNS